MEAACTFQCSNRLIHLRLRERLICFLCEKGEQVVCFQFGLSSELDRRDVLPFVGRKHLLRLLRCVRCLRRRRGWSGLCAEKRRAKNYVEESCAAGEPA